MQLMERLLGERADQGKRVFPQTAPGQNHFQHRSGEFSRDIRRVGNDRQVPKIPEGAGDGGSRSARVEDDHLPLRHHSGCSRRNLQLLLAMQLLFFSQREIFQGAVARWKCTAVGAVNLASSMQDLQVLADGDLGSVELSGQVYDQDSAISTQKIEDCSSPLFV
jgi:hypothetical protein